MAMPKKGLRKVAVAVSTGRVAAVFLKGKNVIGRKMSRTAAQNPQSAARIVQAWITGFKPDHMIVEDPKTALRKGNNAKEILETIATLFDNSDGLDIKLPRIQSYQIKYDEAKALVKLYPPMRKVLPKRPPIWMPEPRNMSYFEALSLAHQLKS